MLAAEALTFHVRSDRLLKFQTCKGHCMRSWIQASMRNNVEERLDEGLNVEHTCKKSMMPMYMVACNENCGRNCTTRIPLMSKASASSIVPECIVWLTPDKSPRSCGL